MSAEPLTAEQIEALIKELQALEYSAEPWTEEDLARRLEILRLLGE